MKYRPTRVVVNISLHWTIWTCRKKDFSFARYLYFPAWSSVFVDEISGHMLMATLYSVTIMVWHVQLWLLWLWILFYDNHFQWKTSILPFSTHLLQIKAFRREIFLFCIFVIPIYPMNQARNTYDTANKYY